MQNTNFFPNMDLNRGNRSFIDQMQNDAHNFDMNVKEFNGLYINDKIL